MTYPLERINKDTQCDWDIIYGLWTQQHPQYKNLGTAIPRRPCAIQGILNRSENDGKEDEFF